MNAGTTSRRRPPGSAQMGGFSAKTPFPTLDQFRTLIHTGQLRYVQGEVKKPARTVPQTNVNWAAEHCKEVRKHLYDCVDAD